MIVGSATQSDGTFGLEAEARSRCLALKACILYITIVCLVNKGKLGGWN